MNFVIFFVIRQTVNANRQRNMSTLPKLTLIPDEKGIEFDPDNLVIDKVTTKDDKMFFNFKYKWTDTSGKAKKIVPKVFLPVLPCRMYEKYNTDYDSVTKKCTITVKKDHNPEIFGTIIDRIAAIEKRQNDLFTNAIKRELKSNKALKKHEKIIDIDVEVKKLDELLFFYEEDKDGNPIDNPEDTQFLSVKIEPDRDWLAPKISVLKANKSDDDDEDDIIQIPETLTYANPRTGKVTEYKDITEKELEWFHLLGVGTQSAVQVNFDSFFVRIENKNLAIYRRTYLAHNAIADFSEKSDISHGADIAQDLYGNDEKVNPDINEKFARLSQYLPKKDNEDNVIYDTPSDKKKAIEDKKKPPAKKVSKKQEDSDDDEVDDKKKPPAKKVSKKQEDSYYEIDDKKKPPAKKVSKKQEDSDDELDDKKKPPAKKNDVSESEEENEYVSSEEDEAEDIITPPKRRGASTKGSMK